MASRCTCGAELPPNAMFCHMCGRPQTELVSPEPEAEDTAHDQQEPAPEAPPKPTGNISFGSPGVVRAAYPPAAVAAIFSFVPFVSMLCFVWYPMAGFASVYLYRVRTGIYLKPGQGARMGGITGLLLFVIMLLVLTVSALLGGAQEFTQAYQQALEQSGQPEEVQRAVRQLLSSPVMVAVLFALGLALQLLITTGLAVVGGALGAKVLEKED